jgi:hypothetical protein
VKSQFQLPNWWDTMVVLQDRMVNANQRLALGGGWTILWQVGR